MQETALAISTLLAVAQCFFGYRLFKILVSVNGFIAGAYLARIFLPEIGITEQPLLLAGVLIGGLAGLILAVSLYLFAVFMIGAVGGGALGSVITQFFNLDPRILIIVAGVAGGALAIIFRRQIIVFATSASGAWVLSYNLYCLYTDCDFRFWEGYGFVTSSGDLPFLLAGFALLTALGIYIQLKYTAPASDGRD